MGFFGEDGVWSGVGVWMFRLVSSRLICMCIYVFYGNYLSRSSDEEIGI